MILSLKNIKEAVERAVAPLENEDLSDIVVALGNTGSGKSTIMTALIKGSKSLKRQEIKIDP